MSVCGQSGQAEEDSGSEEVTSATSAVRDLYKQKPASKVVRVLTVLAYLLSVSLAAILLSVYYVCVWKSPELPQANITNPAAASRLSARQGALSDYLSAGGALKATGGGDSAVNGIVAPTPVPTTNSFENVSTTDTTSDFNTSSTVTSEPLDTTLSYTSSEDSNGTTTSVT